MKYIILFLLVIFINSCQRSQDKISRNFVHTNDQSSLLLQKKESLIHVRSSELSEKFINHNINLNLSDFDKINKIKDIKIKTITNNHNDDITQNNFIYTNEASLAVGLLYIARSVIRSP